MSQTPFLWDKPGEPFATVEAGLDGSLHVYGADPSIDPQSVIADVGDPAILFETPQKSPDGDLWTLKPLGGSGPEGTGGQFRSIDIPDPGWPLCGHPRCGA